MKAQMLLNMICSKPEPSDADSKVAEFAANTKLQFYSEGAPAAQTTDLAASAAAVAAVAPVAATLLVAPGGAGKSAAIDKKAQVAQEKAEKERAKAASYKAAADKAEDAANKASAAADKAEIEAEKAEADASSLMAEIKAQHLDMERQTQPIKTGVTDVVDTVKGLLLEHTSAAAKDIRAVDGETPGRRAAHTLLPDGHSVGWHRTHDVPSEAAAAKDVGSKNADNKQSQIQDVEKMAAIGGGAAALQRARAAAATGSVIDDSKEWAAFAQTLQSDYQSELLLAANDDAK